MIADYITPYGLLFLLDPYNKKEITSIEIDQISLYLDKLIENDMQFMNHVEGKHFITNKINYIANFRSKLQNENQTLKAYDVAINIWPQGEKNNSNYGTYLMSKGYMSKSLRYLNNSYDINPYNLLTNKNLANFMLRIGNYNASLYFIEDYLKLSKRKDGDIEGLLGALYFELKKYNWAINSLKSSLDSLSSKSIHNINEIDYKKKVKWIKLYREMCFEGKMKNL